jgi:hypothetical protein
MSELQGQHQHRGNARVIKLRHFVSRAIVECPDDGADGGGRPNQQRQHLQRLLQKAVRFKGAEYPLFLLEEPPGAWPTQTAARQLDPFDNQFLRWLTPRGQSWKMTTPEWTKASEEANAADAAKADEIRTRSAAERAAKGLEAIEMMRDLARTTPKQAAKRAAVGASE